MTNLLSISVHNHRYYILRNNIYVTSDQSDVTDHVLDVSKNMAEFDEQLICAAELVRGLIQWKKNGNFII